MSEDEVFVRKKFGFCINCMYFDEINDWEEQVSCLYCDRGSGFRYKVKWERYDRLRDGFP